MIEKTAYSCFGIQQCTAGFESNTIPFAKTAEMLFFTLCTLTSYEPALAAWSTCIDHRLRLPPRKLRLGSRDRIPSGYRV
jgi:hypothetical protein